MITTCSLFSFHSTTCFLCFPRIGAMATKALWDADSEFTAAFVPLDLSMGSGAYTVKL